MDKKGFTLTELLIVVSIIAILGAVAVTAYIGTARKAARAEAFANLENLRLLEEQFFAENGNYAPTPPPGPVTVTGTTAIQGVLPGFRPGPGAQFTYAITQQTDRGLPNPVPVPYNGVTVDLPGTPPCFIATATGIAGTRVAGDVFAIDCRNNRNF